MGARDWALYKKTVKGQKTQLEAQKEVIGGANLSSKMPAQTTQVALNKGLNYAVAPTAVPFKEIM